MPLCKTGKSYTIMGCKIEQYRPMLDEPQMERIANYLGVDELDQDEDGVYCNGRRLSDEIITVLLK